MRDALESLERALELYHLEMDALDPLNAYDAWRRGSDAAEGSLKLALVMLEAKVRNGWTTSISLMGVRASSTCGVAGAVANWLVAARKKTKA